MTDTQISINVAKARESMHLTQEEMAEILGMSRQAYGNLERGRTTILNKQLPRIAEVCGISLDKLCTGYEPNTNTQKLKDELQEKTIQLEKMQLRLEDMEKILASQQEHIDSLRGLQRILNYHLGNIEKITEE